MKIVMVTNTYLPFVGGVPNSIKLFADAFRKAGHRVMIIAPEFAGASENEPGIRRVPAIQKFNGGDFSVSLNLPGNLVRELKTIQPDILHSHHPFLLGVSALRLSEILNIPLVYTYHTQYEFYTHYVPVDADLMKPLVKELSRGYCNLADQVIAPSESIRTLLQERGVRTPITVIPTGVDLTRFKDADPARIRIREKIPPSAFVIGHVGRLAEEKNLSFLCRSVMEFIRNNPDSVFLVIGTGNDRNTISDAFRNHGLASNLRMTGSLTNQDLVDAYHAMNIFAFSSKTETQGMVLVEAMASRVPVAALDAPGAREVVEDSLNGRLVRSERPETFAQAMQWLHDIPPDQMDNLRAAALETAHRFSLDRSVSESLEMYREIIRKAPIPDSRENSEWSHLIKRIRMEWDIWVNRASAINTIISSHETELDPG
ncbi:glycosyltransferase [bacterium]|nr:glycosyltransferase [candidate division CSSED10-310 bacterium]